MSQFYNLTTAISITGKVFVKITECNSSGTDLAATGGNSGISAIGVRYYPTGDVGSRTAGFRVLYENGGESIMLNTGNLKNCAGSPVGVRTTYQLYVDTLDGITI